MPDEAPLSPLPDSVASDLSPLSISGLSEDDLDEQVLRLQRKIEALHQGHRRTARQLERCLNRAIASDGRQRSMGGSSKRALLLDSEDAFSMSSMSFRGGTLSSSRGSTADEDLVRQSSPRASTAQPEEEDDAERQEERAPQEGAEKLVLEHKQAKETTQGESGSDASQGDDPEPEPHRKDSPRDDADAPVVVAPPCGTPGETPCDGDPMPLPPRILIHVPTPQQQRRHLPQKQTLTALQRRRREPDTGSTPIGRSSSGSEVSGNGEPSHSREDDEVSLADQSALNSTFSELDTSAASVTVPLDCGCKVEGAETHDAADAWDPEDFENNAWRIWRTAAALSTPEEQARYLQNFPVLFKQWQEGYVHTHVPRPGEESLQRRDTILGRLEQNEMAQTITITVPEGMGEERRVSFNWANKQMEVVVPADYGVGSQLPIIVPKKPPLEKNRTVAHVRDHANLPDFVSVWSVVRHPPQPQKYLTKDAFGCDETKGRLQQYKQLGGKNMTPLLPFTPEEEES
jgi:hypothetical protein